MHRPVTFCTPEALSLRLVPLAIIGALLAGCGDSSRAEKPKPATGTTKTGAVAGAGADSDELDPAMTRELREKEVQSYVAAFKDLKQLGALTEQELGDDPSELRQLATAFSLPGKWESSLKKHGFDSESFSEVHVAVIGALGALMSEDMKAQFAEQRKNQAKQIDELRKVLSAEEVAELEKGLEEAQNDIQSLYDGVPEQNLDLVRKYRAQLEAAFE